MARPRGYASRVPRRISHPDLRWKRCDVKSTNLLGNVLAIETAHRAGCQEAVLVDARRAGHRGHALVAHLGARRPLEGTPEGHEILPGMTRQHILRLADKIGISVCPDAGDARRNCWPPMR